MSLLLAWLAVATGVALLAQMVWLSFAVLGLLGPIAAAYGAVVALALCLAPKGPTPIEPQRRWEGPAAALVATLLLAGLALTAARIQPAVPRTDALFYELDAQTGNARWLASPSAAQSGSSTTLWLNSGVKNVK